MGYTHYWNRRKTLPRAKWNAAVWDCRRVTSALDADIQYEFDDTCGPAFGPDFMQFNGPGESGHETFRIDRTSQDAFDFCKTARKPYDAAVCACLIVLQHHLGRAFRVSSDGGDDTTGWVLAREACQKTLGYGSEFFLPLGTRLSRAGLPLRACGDRVYSVLGAGETWRILPLVGGGWGVCEYAWLQGGHWRKIDGLSPCRSLAGARWVATLRWLKQEFPDPEGEAFLAAAPPGEWTPVLAWLDHMTERGNRQAARLRSVLPRGVVAKPVG